MSREVSPALSAHIVALLKVERPRFKSQNKMAEAIGIPGGSLSNVMAQKKGIGDDILEKIEAFLGRTRGQLEAEANSSVPVKSARVFVPDRDERRAGSLAKVRDKLYKRYDKARVDEKIATSEFIDAASIDELEAFETLDDLLRMERAEDKGRLVGRAPVPEHPATPPRVGPPSSRPSRIPPEKRKLHSDHPAKLPERESDAPPRAERAGKKRD